ncbi:CRTAC1 family protein [Halochromatium glycolicum]|nr:CRTAC1 family protein [Halochromatium glycolicum]
MSRATSAGIVAVLIIGAVAFSDALAINFEVVTDGSNIDYFGESKGAAWGDFNQDGWPDIWVTNRYSPFALYVNNGDGSFVDSSSVIDTPGQGAYGAAWGDFDNDGDADILNMGPGGCGGICGSVTSNKFLVNERGFLVDQTLTFNLTYPEHRGRMSLWFDWNNDGRLDVLFAGVARPDGLGPSAIFTQTDYQFVDDTWMTGLSSGSSLQGQLARLTPGGRPFVFLLGPRWVSSPRAVYDYTSLPFVDSRESLGIGSWSDVTDAVIADLNGDLKSDMFLTRWEYSTAATKTGPAQVDAWLRVNSDQKGFRFKAPGQVQFTIVEAGLVLGEVYIGAAAAIQVDSFTFTLSSNDPDTHGIYPHSPGRDTGIYIGYDPATQVWEVQHSDSEPAGRFVRVRADMDISEFRTVGFESSDGALTDRLLLQTDEGFTEATTDAGLDWPTSCNSVIAADFDNDMDLDLYLVCLSPLENRPNILYENLGDGTFVEVPGAGGAAGSSVGRGDGAAAADYDRDGFIDLFVTNGWHGPAPYNEGPHQLFRNLGNANHWLEIDLEGTRSNRDGIGAQVLATAGGVTQVRDQNAGIHQFNQDHQRLHFGLGPNVRVDELVIHWPSGIEQRLAEIPADQIIRIAEPGPPFAPGAPVYVPGQDAGVYLWKETFDGPYHLRVSADWDSDSPYALVETTLLAERPVDAVLPVALEANDVLTHRQNRLSLTSWVGPSDDGVNFAVPGGTDALISVQQDGVSNPRQLHVGPSGEPIPAAGFVLNADDLPAMPNFKPGQDLGLFIGEEAGAQVVTARWSGDDMRHRSAFSLLSSEPLLAVNPVRLESDDVVTTGPYHAQVRGSLVNWQDGVDVEIVLGSILGIAYEQDGLMQPHLVNPATRDLGMPNAYRLPRAEPYGKPVYDPGTEAGLFLWKDKATGTWHLRGAAGGGYSRYAGELVSDQPFTTVSAVGLEANDVLDTTEPARIAFDLQMWQQWQDGIDFQFPPEANVSFTLQPHADDSPADALQIGAERWPVEQVPLDISGW